MADSDVVSQSSGSPLPLPLPRKRARDDEESSDVMESVTDLGQGLVFIPEAKKPNAGPRSPLLAQDADLMALLDRIDKMDSYTDEDGFSCEAQPSENERCRDSSIAKSSEETEMGAISKHSDSASSIGDGSDVGDLQAYANGNVLGEFDFNVFLDSADELAMGLNQFPYYDGDVMAAISSEGLSENTAYNEVAAEVFHGSLWEDDIWQLTDINEIQQGS